MLTPDDLHPVTSTLSILSHEWLTLGVLIGVPMSRLKEINADYSIISANTCLLQMFSCCTERHECLCTWRVLVAAVKHFNIPAAKKLLSFIVTSAQLTVTSLQLQSIDFPPPVRKSVTRVTLCDLLRELLPFASRWHEIGASLGASPDAVRSVWQDYHTSRDRLREILHVVLTRTRVDLTWSAVQLVTSGLFFNPLKNATNS